MLPFLSTCRDVEGMDREERVRNNRKKLSLPLWHTCFVRRSVTVVLRWAHLPVSSSPLHNIQCLIFLKYSFFSCTQINFILVPPSYFLACLWSFFPAYQVFSAFLKTLLSTSLVSFVFCSEGVALRLWLLFSPLLGWALPENESLMKIKEETCDSKFCNKDLSWDVLPAQPSCHAQEWGPAVIYEITGVYRLFSGDSKHINELHQAFYRS